jgi:hypothetical protein
MLDGMEILALTLSDEIKSKEILEMIGSLKTVNQAASNLLGEDLEKAINSESQIQKLENSERSQLRSIIEEKQSSLQESQAKIEDLERNLWIAENFILERFGNMNGYSECLQNEREQSYSSVEKNTLIEWEHLVTRKDLSAQIQNLEEQLQATTFDLQDIVGEYKGLSRRYEELEGGIANQIAYALNDIFQGPPDPDASLLNILAHTEMRLCAVTNELRKMSDEICDINVQERNRLSEQSRLSKLEKFTLPAKMFLTEKVTSSPTMLSIENIMSNLEPAESKEYKMAHIYDTPSSNTEMVLIVSSNRG